MGLYIEKGNTQNRNRLVSFIGTEKAEDLRKNLKNKIIPLNDIAFHLCMGDGVIKSMIDYMESGLPFNMALDNCP